MLVELASYVAPSCISGSFVFGGACGLLRWLVVVLLGQSSLVCLGCQLASTCLHAAEPAETVHLVNIL